MDYLFEKTFEKFELYGLTVWKNVCVINFQIVKNIDQVYFYTTCTLKDVLEIVHYVRF